MQLHRLVLSAAAFASLLSAQDPVVRRALRNSTTSEPELVRSMLSNQKGTAATADGRLWSLVHWTDGSWKSSGNKLDPQRDKSRHLLLFVSSDGGRSWTQAADTRTTGDAYGSMVVDPDGYTLHLTWYGWNGKKTATGWFNSVFYAAFDARQGKWKGTGDTVLVAGSNPSSQSYSTPDIAITEDGVIGVAFACARGVPPGWVGGGGSWNSGLVWRAGGKWSKPHRINADGTGVSANIHAQGQYFHMCYRVATGGYGIEYRRFDTKAGKLDAEIPIVPDTSNPRRNARTVRANNISHLAVLPSGDVWVLYARATASRGGGQLWFVHMPAGKKAFQSPVQVDDDSAMGWGNNTYRFHDLALDDGKVVAVYSKLVEKNRNLYTRVLLATRAVPPYPTAAIKLRTGVADDQFGPFVSGHRAWTGRTSRYATYTDLRPVGPLTGGTVRFLGAVDGVAVFKGRGCRGSLPRVPALAASSLPRVGKTFGLAATQHPASTAAILFLGLDDKKLLGSIPLPLDLTGVGAAGCFLSQDIPLTGTYAVDAQGNGSLTVPLPNDKVFAGLPMFWQSFVVARNANRAGGVLTNGLATIAR